MRKRYRRRTRRVRWLFLPIFLLLAFLALELQLRPAIEREAEQLLHQTVMVAVNDAVGKTLSGEDTGYDSLINFEKDESGQITAMKTDVQSVNLLKTEIMSRIFEELDNMEESKLSIPLGTLSGWSILSGFGPEIKVRIQPLATSQAEFQHQFTSAGINQTRHQILLAITVDLRLLLPGNKLETQVSQTVPIAETVILGNIPGHYAYFAPAGDLSSSEKSGILYAD